MSYLILLLLIFLTGVSVGEEPNCDPDCAGKTSGDFVADQEDCKRFYVCLADDLASDTSFPCPDGTSFNVETSDCSGPDECTSTCLPFQCHLSCNAVPELIANPKDCGSFFICTGNGVAGPVPCPLETPFFNGNVCSTDFLSCCKDFCTAYCFQGVDRVADPRDCTRYYRCAREGPVEEALHMTCPGGQNFDIPSATCAPGATCTVLCDESQPVTKTSSVLPPSSVPPTSVPPTGDPPTSVSPTSVSPTSACLTSLTCTEVGYFAQCTTCVPDYFRCSVIGQEAEHEKCTGSLVFNPNPLYPMCILPSNCPYTPAGLERKLLTP